MTDPAPENRHVALASGITADLLVKGEGTPLIFLHPSQGRLWSAFHEGLAAHYQVIAPLTPGGEDEGELMLFDSFADLALFYDDLMDALGLDRAIVAGHGFGGMAAAEFAAHYPHRVSRLVLIGSYGLWIDDNPVTDIHSADLPQVPHLLFADGDGRIAKDVVYGPEGSDPSMYWLQTSLAEAACTHFYWPIPDRDLKRRLYRITAPTLLLWGTEDRIVPVAYADAFAAGLRRSETRLIAGGSHFAHLEHADEAVRAITEFAAAQTEPA
jgi:pimeloyl-ACP methyl ester carboxylesterase